ncbi:MAG: hypothetical protein AAGA99_01180 [Actinomycetota bacterium]
MTPTLLGRIQSRLVLLATVGVVWTLIIGPFLPADGALSDVYSMAFRALAATAILGVVLWEPLYHGLQQIRWEKDWPTSLGLVTGIPEGLLVWLLVFGDGMSGVTSTTFWLHFGTTWVLVWAAANGPLQIVLIRWRYRGGRVW